MYESLILNFIPPKMNQHFRIHIASAFQNNKNNTEQSVGKGGYGIVVQCNDQPKHEFSKGFSNTTIARMDLKAVVHALQSIEKPSNLIFYLNNQYVIDTIQKDWLSRWKKDNFKDKKHSDLWKEIDNLLQLKIHRVTFLHIKMSDNNLAFQRAKQIAINASQKKNLVEDINIGSQNRSETPETNIKNGPKLNSICVDASCMGNPGIMEYRGVLTQNGKEIFRRKYQEGTNNIGEFLAIVHALALYKNENISLPLIYSDSQIAIGWVKKKQCKTTLTKNAKNTALYQHIERAIQWLKNNQYDTKILKWPTESWGEIPADFGRK